MSDDATWLDQAVNALKKLKEGWKLFEWFRKKFAGRSSTESGQSSEPSPGILIIGPGGVGKTTLAKMLSGEMAAWLFGDAWKYEESIGEETFQFFDAPGVEVVVPPGQQYRRDAQWADVRADITNGRYAGVILVTAFGYHTLTGGYKHHPLYAGNIDQFRTDYRREKLADELSVLKFLAPALESAPGRLWFLTFVGKQDLWWDKRGEADQHYRQGEWATTLATVSAKLGAKNFLHETVLASVLPTNLEDADGEVLFKTAVGYDMRKHSESVQRLMSVLDGLRQWEGQA